MEKGTVGKSESSQTTPVHPGQGLNPDKPFKATITFHSPPPPSPPPTVVVG